MIERQIFEFHDGITERVADPIDLHVAIQTAKINWEQIEALQKQINETGEANPVLLKDFAEQVREIFGIVPVRKNPETGQVEGLTIVQTIEVFSDFMEYCDTLKKTDESKPSSPPPMAAKSSG